MKINTKQMKVAVIGAGIAGLSCALALQKQGFEVTVFEKSRGVSGRLSTRVTERWQCDHGAQYFTAKDSLFDAEVQRWLVANVAQEWQPTLYVFDGHTFSQKETEHQTTRYVGYPRNNSPAQWLAQALNIRAETTVISIQKHHEQWQVFSKEQGLHAEQFDAIILAIPAPQATLLLNATKSKFAHLCEGVTMQPCFALMVHVEQKIKCQFDGLFINKGLLSWVARDTAKPGRAEAFENDAETWVLHASSQWSEAHVNDERSLVSEHMLSEFKRILHLDSAYAAAEQVTFTLEHCVLHRWLYADCDTYLTDIYLFDDDQNIGICGDWLNGGKIQGAWLSGLKLADALISNNKNTASVVEI